MFDRDADRNEKRLALHRYGDVKIKNAPKYIKDLAPLDKAATLHLPQLRSIVPPPPARWVRFSEPV